MQLKCYLIKEIFQDTLISFNFYLYDDTEITENGLKMRLPFTHRDLAPDREQGGN